MEPISAGDWTVFFTRPLSATILLLAALALFGPNTSSHCGPGPTACPTTEQAFVVRDCREPL
jgi:hypothetical protein